jgi:replicative DNA helicase
MTDVDRLPPHNREAERRLLGGILRYPDSMLTLAGSLKPEQFYHDAHRRVFRAMVDLFAARKPLDLVLVHEQIIRNGDTADAGLALLAELWESEPTGVEFEHHAAVVRDTATVRTLIHAAHETLRDCYDRAAPADELLADAERRILGIGEQATPITDTVRSAQQFLPAAAARIDARIAVGASLRGLATGYAELDDVLGGMRPGEQIVIAARPSVGKTAFATSLLSNVATDGVPAMLFSLEMPEADIADRLLAMGSGVPLHRFTRAPRLTPEDASRLADAAGPNGLGGCPLFIDDTSAATAARIAAVTRRMVRRHGVKIVAVDYLGLMRPENTRCNKAEQIGTLALRMKELARECGVTMLLLAQENREHESRGGKPKLSDLRDSGEIEQHADRVIMLWRKPDLPSDQEVWPVEVTIAKNRNGPIGDLTFNYRRPVLRFEDASSNW